MSTPLHDGAAAQCLMSIHNHRI